MDDIFIVADPQQIDEIRRTLENEMNGLKIKREDEDEEKSIKYLDLRITRRETTVKHTWQYKTLGSKRMIDYYTTYDMTSKLNVYKELYQRAQAVTNQRLDQVKKEMEEIMKENHYPEEIIKNILQLRQSKK